MLNYKKYKMTEKDKKIAKGLIERAKRELGISEHSNGGKK